MASYNETDPVPKDLDWDTPTEGATSPAEVNNAIREAKRVLKVESAIITTTDNLQLTEQHSTILVNGAHTVTLPTIADVSSSTFTRRYRIINISASTGVLKTKAGGETLNGNDYSSTGLNLAQRYAEYVIYGNGTVWYMETSYILASPTISGTVDGGATYTAPILTSPILTSPTLNTGVSGSAVLDQDDLTGDSATKIATQQSIKAYANVSFEVRAKFTDHSASIPFTFLVDAASYKFNGTNSEFIYWSNRLTTVAAAPSGGNTFMYLYLDDTAIAARTGMSLNRITDTSAPAALIWSETAPTYSQVKNGFYNGDDRCIYFGLSNTGNTTFIVQVHDGGDFVLYGSNIEDRALADLDTTWVDVALTIPEFCTKAQVAFKTFYNAGAGTELLFRVNGTNSTGHTVGETGLNTARQWNTLIVLTDSAQKIEIKHSVGGNDQAAVFTNGWFFPKGI